MNRRIRYILIGGVIGFLLTASVTWALAQEPEPTYIFACVKKGAITLVTDQGDCKKNDIVLQIPTSSMIENLQQVDAQLQANIDAVQNDANTRIAALEDLLVHFSRDGNEITISGANLNVVNGTGSTDGEPNSLGNVIIGYNEDPCNGCFNTEGSHNLVVGKMHSYSRFGGIVSGFWNTISGDYASVTGGSENTASGNAASVSGGYQAVASGGTASVSGGISVHAGGDGASVSGGYQNSANGWTASITGGRDNIASGDFGSISGGKYLVADGAAEWRGGVYFTEY